MMEKSYPDLIPYVSSCKSPQVGGCTGHACALRCTAAGARIVRASTAPRSTRNKRQQGAHATAAACRRMLARQLLHDAHRALPSPCQPPWCHSCAHLPFQVVVLLDHALAAGMPDRGGSLRARVDVHSTLCPPHLTARLIASPPG